MARHFSVDRRLLLRNAGAAGLLLGTGLSLAPGPSFAQAKRGGTLSIAVRSPTYPLDPHKAGDVGSRSTFAPAINYLVRVTSDLRVVPELATAWNSADARVWTVKLRPGVKFHDGRPLTGEDVVATFERLVDPQSGSTAVSTFRSYLAKGGTTKIDDLTVRFELTRAVADFPYSLFTYQAAILPANWPGDFAKNPAGTGPFRMTSYVAKQGAEFSRNPDYWEPGLPYLERLRFVYFEDTASMIAALQSGEIDLMLNVPLDAVEPLRAGSGVKIVAGRSATHGQLAMRVDTKPFDDKRVRQALALSIDREKIVRNLWSGLADLGNDHIIAPSYPIATYVKLPQRKQDYDQAKRLLAEAGHPNGIDVELVTHPSRSLPSYAQVIQDMAKPAGIRIKLTVEPSDIYYKHWNEVPVGMENWGHRPTPGQLLNLAYRCGGTWNVPHWCNQQFDALTTELDATLDEQKRGQLAGRIAALMHDETPAIITYFEQTVKATTARVNGVAGEATDYLDLRATWLG